MPTIFTVLPEDLGRLGPARAIRFMAELLWAEARRLRLPNTAVSISSRLTTPDGGVDAQVSGDVSDDGLLTTGETAFQVKTGAFQPWQPAVIRRELFGTAAPSQAALGEAVRRCMDAGGRYVLVCTGEDLTALQRTQSTEGIQEAFRTIGYLAPRVDVLSQNQLIACLEVFPSQCLVINGRAGARFQSWKSWSENDQMRPPFVAGEPQRALIEGMRAGLNGTTSAVHIRVRGEPGIGKTRSVLECLRPDDLAPLVLYSPNPQLVRDTLLDELVRDDNVFEVILVVDECNVDHAVLLWDRLKHRGPRIRLVTIYNEYDHLDVTYVDPRPLERSEIEQILQPYMPVGERADRWVEYCDGSPRVAHILGTNLQRHPEDLLTGPGTANVWDRYVAGPDAMDSEVVQQRRRVLRYLALFKRFGYGGPLVDEARVIAGRIERADRDITWERFQEIVATLKARRILQGEQTLYITPRLLHIKLWAEWWENHGNGFDLASFTDGLPPALNEWFYDMFRYAAESQAATNVVRTLLGPNGPFANGEFLTTEGGARFFRALTDASPQSALRRLQATVGTWSREALLRFTTGRRDVVFALERIAVWRELAADAARLLLHLAEAENETWSNNATGVFADLFSPGHGPVAPTEASPEVRFPVLVEALTSESPARRAVGLKAAERALKISGFSRIVGAEYQGLRRAPLLWRPQAREELIDAYRRVWRFLLERLDQVDIDERTAIVDLLLNHARSLYHSPMAAIVIETLEQLAARPDVDRKRLIKLVEGVLHHDGRGLTPEQRAPWEALRATLVGTDFASRMRRYVAMELLEDHFDDADQHVDKAGPQIATLAEEAFEQPERLWPELGWLMESGAQNAYRFGHQLGTRDPACTLLPRLIAEQRQHHDVFFLAGYLRSLFELDREAWERLLDDFVSDATLRTFVPELTWRGGLTDRAAHRVLTLVQSQIVNPETFRMFAFGGVTRDLSPAAFGAWIEFLLGLETRSAALMALDLYHPYYAWQEPSNILPEALTFRLLTAPSLFKADESSLHATGDDHDWTQIANRFVTVYPGRLVELARAMVVHLGEDDTIISRFDSPTLEILAKAMREHPAEMWRHMQEYLGPPIDDRAFTLTHWLREGHLSQIPANLIWEWIDRDRKKRAWYVASFVPPVFVAGTEASLVRDLLIRYGNREDVRRNLFANFSSEMWSGPESEHLARKLEGLRELRRREGHANVQRWLDEYVASVEVQRDRARMMEEREF